MRRELPHRARGHVRGAKLGPLDRVPMVVVPRTQMRWLSIDHRAGFVLSLVDGLVVAST